MLANVEFVARRRAPPVNRPGRILRRLTAILPEVLAMARLLTGRTTWMRRRLLPYQPGEFGQFGGQRFGFGSETLKVAHVSEVPG